MVLAFRIFAFVVFVAVFAGWFTSTTARASVRRLLRRLRTFGIARQQLLPVLDELLGQVDDILVFAALSQLVYSHSDS